jgi:hypothetical protein
LGVSALGEESDGGFDTGSSRGAGTSGAGGGTSSGFEHPVSRTNTVNKKSAALACRTVVGRMFCSFVRERFVTKDNATTSEGKSQ